MRPLPRPACSVALKPKHSLTEPYCLYIFIQVKEVCISRAPAPHKPLSLHRGEYLCNAVQKRITFKHMVNLLVKL